MLHFSRRGCIDGTISSHWAQNFSVSPSDAVSNSTWIKNFRLYQELHPAWSSPVVTHLLEGVMCSEFRAYFLLALNITTWSGWLLPLCVLKPARLCFPDLCHQQTDCLPFLIRSLHLKTLFYWWPLINVLPWGLSTATVKPLHYHKCKHLW